MKLSGEVTRQTKQLCDDVLFEEALSKFEGDGPRARYMISKYASLASSAAILRKMPELAEKISVEAERSPAVSIKDLSINGNDLIVAGIEAKRIGAIMNSLLLSVIEHPEENLRERLIEKALLLSIRKEI
jgi:hypothetical protein